MNQRHPAYCGDLAEEVDEVIVRTISPFCLNARKSLNELIPIAASAGISSNSAAGAMMRRGRRSRSPRCATLLPDSDGSWRRADLRFVVDEMDLGQDAAVEPANRHAADRLGQDGMDMCVDDPGNT